MNRREYKLQLLAARVERESKKEFGTWEEGGPLIEVTLIDRKTHEHLHYVPIPYWHKASRADQREILRLAMMNLGIAYNAVQLAWSLNYHAEMTEEKNGQTKS